MKKGIKSLEGVKKIVRSKSLKKLAKKMLKPEDAEKAKTEEPRKPHTITVESKVELEVAQLLYSIVEQHGAKYLLRQMMVNTYMEGPAQCSMLLFLKDKKQLDKISENVDASHALVYLLENWDKCVAGGKEIIENRWNKHKERKKE